MLKIGQHLHGKVTETEVDCRYLTQPLRRCTVLLTDGLARCPTYDGQQLL